MALKMAGSAAGKSMRRVLYDNHFPTTPVQKVLLAFGSALTVFSDPERGDMLATLGEVTGAEALKQMHLKMCSDPVGVEILATKPRIRSTEFDVDQLRTLPKNTFGYAYTQFMDAHGYVH